MVVQPVSAKRPRVAGSRLSRRNGSASRRRLLALFAAGCGLAIVWAAFELGQVRAGYNRFSAQEQEQELRSQLLEAQRDNGRLREQMAALETNAKVEAESYRQVEARLSGLQDQIQSQSEDLAFYRGIVSVDEKAGLRVQDFELSRVRGEGEYTLRLVLAQALRNDKRISGAVDLAIEGTKDGETAVLGMSELSPAPRLEFSFRYFENLESLLTIPPGFEPARVIVTLKPKGQGGAEVEKAFDWAVGPD
jgi:hypothetical protein